MQRALAALVCIVLGFTMTTGYFYYKYIYPIYNLPQLSSVSSQPSSISNTPKATIHVNMPNGDGPTALSNMGGTVASYFGARQYADIDQLLVQWSNPDQRMYDGMWKLSGYLPALNFAWSTYLTDWDKNYDTIQDWKKQDPQSVAAAITEAFYWESYAWNARGNGYANTVTADRTRLFKERLEKAQEILVASKSYASNCPLWYQISIEVAKALGADRSVVYDLFKEGAQKQSLYYSLYFSTVGALEPKWGGSWDLVDKFIQDGVLRIKDKEGDVLYARLYWYISSKQGPEFDLFRDTKASWSEMKKSFETLMAAYPNSFWNLNNFASFACRAGDGETFNSLRFKIGEHVMSQAWPTNYSLDLCEQKYSKNL